MKISESRVEAGFPSPAESYSEKSLDLNDLCVENEAATFFVRVSGESMKDAGIFHEDILIVDRSLEVSRGDIAIFCIDGEFTVKRLSFKKNGHPILLSANSVYSDIVIDENSDFSVWGVVTFVIHRTR